LRYWGAEEGVRGPKGQGPAAAEQKQSALAKGKSVFLAWKNRWDESFFL